MTTSVEPHAGKKSNTPSVLIYSLVLFAALTALTRALNIAVYLPSLTEKVPIWVPITLDIIHDVLIISSYAFAISLTVFSVRALKNSALVCASVCTAVIFADRAFCLVWDIASSNISVGEKRAFSDAVTWLLIDVVFFAVTFFASAIITGFINKKNGDDANELLPIKEAVFSSLVLTLLQLSSKAVICIQFMMAYDDVTATEYAQMAGDILLVILKYGVFMSGVAVFAYRILYHIHRKKSVSI